MGRVSGAIAALCVALAMTFAQSKMTRADVVINNVLSPFVTIEVGPGHRVYGPSPYWLNNPRHHQRCYRRWDSYFGEWHVRCVRMRYWGDEPYWD